MLKILIADDEALARETIKMLLAEDSDITAIFEAEDGKIAANLAHSHQPDIAFLDIEMPGESGIELARKLSDKCVVVFVTAYNEYAVEAFELNAMDYLLKPFSDERFYAALRRAKERMSEDHGTEAEALNNAVQQFIELRKNPLKSRLVIREPGRIRLVSIDDIEYISGAGNYVEIHLLDGKQILHRETMSAMEEQLDPDTFVRIHRSSIVRRSCVTELRPNDKGDYQVVLKSGVALTLSRRNKAKFEQLLM